MGTGNGASLLGILPLIAAGFIFNGIFYVTRFRLAKADGQRLFFSCVIAGFIIGFLAFLIRGFVRHKIVHASLLQVVMDWLHDVIPVAFGLTYLLAIALAVVLGAACNIALWVCKCLVAPRDRRRLSVWVYWKNMSEHVTALDELLRRAVFEDALVLLCLKSRKVYCGAVSDITGKQQSAIAHVQLIPTFSITRDKDSLKFLPDTRTDYRAYGLKLAFDRGATLDRLIRSFVKVYRALADAARDARRSSGGLHKRVADTVFDRLVRIAVLIIRLPGIQASQGQADTDFQAKLKMHIKALLKERRRLREVLQPYSQSGHFDVSVWTKVIPVTEIESASLYKKGSYGKWFEAPEGAGHAPDGTGRFVGMAQ